MQGFHFCVNHQQEHARAGEMQTAHGVVRTPIFMPVGTQATVKALDPEDLNRCGAQILLANTYHLHLRPGEETVDAMGGIQRFMHWDKPVLTDSGGFQVFSLGKQMEKKEGMGSKSLPAHSHSAANLPDLVKNSSSLLEVDSATPSSRQRIFHSNSQAFASKGSVQVGSKTAFASITDEGVSFRSHLDGSTQFFSPEKAMEIQRLLGADIVMAFDECTPDDATPTYAREALDRTHRWARRCKTYWDAHERLSAQGTYQALFGIVQGAMHKDLRRESTAYIADLGVDGLAMGGETVGYNMAGTVELMDWVRDLLPQEKPRYAMGLGFSPQDIVDAVRAGFDMFDCVAPTRIARNGALYVGQLTGKTPQEWRIESLYPKARLQIGNAQWARSPLPIMEGCDCWTCQQGFTRAYLHHLYKTQELLYYRLASIHNVRFMIRLTEQLREQL